MDEQLIKRIQPHHQEAEQAVIGSMIMEPEAIIVASGMLTAEDFYSHQLGVLFDTIVEIYNEGKPVDLITLQNKLREKDVLPEVCDLKYISGLVNSVPTSQDVKIYAEIVSEKATLRRLIHTSETIANSCYLDKDKADNILDDAEKKIFEITQKRNQSDYEDIKDIVLRSLDQIEMAARNKSAVTGVATGFTDLDAKTAGLQPSDLILIAARPSMGKTALALNIAEYVAVRSHICTAIFSLEMSKTQLVNRLLSMNAKVDSKSIRIGDLKDNQWADVMESARKIGDSALIIDDTPGISIGELRSKCRKYKVEHNLGLVIIDYLQLMSGGKGSESRQQEISEISRSLKALAREINCPVVALSQLSRAVEQRQGPEGKRPMLSDLRESGAIEQDADVVMFIYRDDYYNKDSEEKGVSEIIIAKQRNGPVGTIKLKWLPDFTKFANKVNN